MTCNIVPAYEMRQKAHEASIAYQVANLRSCVCKEIEQAASKGLVTVEVTYGLVLDCSDAVSAFIMELKRAGYTVTHVSSAQPPSSQTNHTFTVGWSHLPI